MQLVVGGSGIASDGNISMPWMNEADIMPDWFEQEDIDARQLDFYEWQSQRERFMEASDNGSKDEDTVADSAEPRG